MKYRVTGVHKSTEDGTVQAGNPLGSTDKYSVLRYEKIMDGKTTTLVDIMTGTIKFNGKDVTNVVQNMLN